MAGEFPGFLGLRKWPGVSCGNWKLPEGWKTSGFPPGNRLEALKGDRAGQYSIRINDQFRICFRWTASGAEDVEIVDYH